MRAVVDVFDMNGGIRKKKKRGAARLPVFFISTTATHGFAPNKRTSNMDLGEYRHIVPLYRRHPAGLLSVSRKTTPRTLQNRFLLQPSCCSCGATFCHFLSYSSSALACAGGIACA